MSNYRNILLIADPGTRPTPAMVRAAHLARVTGATVHLVCFAHDRAISALRLVGVGAMESARTAFVEHCWKRMDLLASLPPLQGVSPTVDVVYQDHLIEAVLGYVRTRQIDLIIKDVARESRIHRLLVNPFEYQLLRRMPQTLMLVNTDAATPPRRIVATVDTSDSAFDPINEQVVRLALGLALQCDARLELLHVFEGISPVALMDHAAGGSFIGEAYSTLLELGRARFERYADTQGVPQSQRHFITGSMPDALANFAFDASNDILVVGSGLSSQVERSLIGSTAEQILSVAHCDLVLAKPLPKEHR
jgi:universal stress protein E